MTSQKKKPSLWFWNSVIKPDAIKYTIKPLQLSMVGSENIPQALPGSVTDLRDQE